MSENEKSKKIDWGRWEVIVGIVGLLTTVAVSFYILKLQTKESALSYSVLSSEPLVDVKDTLGGRLRFSFDGKPLGQPKQGRISGASDPAIDLYFSYIEIQNSGTEPLKAVDFEGPLTVTLGPGVHVYSRQISKKLPPTLQAYLLPLSNKSPDKSRIHLKTGLLNPGDSIVLKVVSSGTPQITVSGRIVGVKEITKRETLTSKDKNTVTPTITFILFVVCAFLWLYLWLLTESQLKRARVEVQEHRVDSEKIRGSLLRLLNWQRDKRSNLDMAVFTARLHLRPLVVNDEEGRQALSTLYQTLDNHVNEEKKLYDAIYEELWPPSP